MRVVNGLILSLVVASLALPRDASAQSEPVFRALLSLHATLDGPYGDEGPEVSRRFDELMQAVAGWDRTIPAEAVGDNLHPITAYLTLMRSANDVAPLTARLTLRDTVQDVIRGARTQPPSRFPQAALIDEAGGGAPRFPLARYADVFASALQGQIDETIARMKTAAATDSLIVDPASRSVGMQQAAVSLRRGNLRDAIATLETVVKASPASSEAHRMLGTAAGIAGNSRTSVQHFEAALRIRPDDERSWIALANTQAEAGLLADAARTLEKAVAAIPESGGLRWRLAGLLVRLEHVGDALAQYTEAERLMPVSGRAAVHQAVATAATLQLDVERATAAGEQRARANLNDAAAHRDLAGLYVKQGRQEEAFAELAIAAWLDPDDPLTFVALGHSLMADHRDEDAVAALERAVSLQPDLRDARYALAQALTRASRRADAERHLAEFERQRAEAVARERRALDIDAARSEAAMKSAAGQHRQAVENRQQVIALEPGVAQNYLDLAEALVKAGRLAESLQYFVKTAEMDGVAEVHLRLADVLARLGRARESALARETYERLRLEDFRRRSPR
jgi:tetratricopeptide (TPR) repeat protein